MLDWIGYALLLAGAGVSVATIAHNIKRRRIARELPQGAPGRVGPEVHAIGALLTGIGGWLAWDWQAGLLAMLPQGVIALALIVDMMEQNCR